MGNYKGINQKGLTFHVEAKQKNYKEEKKLRKSYEVPPSLWCLFPFIGFSTTTILGKYCSLDFVNSFQLSRRIIVF